MNKKHKRSGGWQSVCVDRTNHRLENGKSDGKGNSFYVCARASFSQCVSDFLLFFSILCCCSPFFLVGVGGGWWWLRVCIFVGYKWLRTWAAMVTKHHIERGDDGRKQKKKRARRRRDRVMMTPLSAPKSIIPWSEKRKHLIGADATNKHEHKQSMVVVLAFLSLFFFAAVLPFPSFFRTLLAHIHTSTCTNPTPRLSCIPASNIFFW